MDAEDQSFGSITDSTPGRGFTLTSEDEPASSGTITFTPGTCGREDLAAVSSIIAGLCTNGAFLSLPHATF